MLYENLYRLVFGCWLNLDLHRGRTMLKKIISLIVLAVVSTFCFAQQNNNSFYITGNSFKEIMSLESGDDFGNSVAVYGEFAVIGASTSSDISSNMGAVYIYQKTESEWVFLDKLFLSDGSSWDEFGKSVSIFNDTIVVGCPGDDDKGENSGSVYIYKYKEQKWSYDSKLLPLSENTYDCFGCSVDAYGDYIVVGAKYNDLNGYNSGSAYIYEYIANQYVLQQTVSGNGTKNGLFGNSVSIYGGTVAVGAIADDNVTGDNSGIVYVYSGSADNWVREAVLKATNSQSHAGFGSSIDIYNDVIAIGALWDDERGIASGAAYIYRKNVNSWTLEQQLDNPFVYSGDRMGNSIAVNDKYAIVGCCGVDSDTNFNAGGFLIYKYAQDVSAWSFNSRYISGSNEDYGQVGRSMAFDGTYLAVGQQNGKVDVSNIDDIAVDASNYSLAVEVLGNGTVSSEGGYYSSGTKVTINAFPDDGWRVKSWSGTDDDSSTALWNSVTVDSSKNTKVVFELIPVYYQLNVRAYSAEGGTVSQLGTESYLDGTQVTLTATPNQGWYISRWNGTDNDNSKAETNTVVMNSYRSVTVYFNQKQTLSLNSVKIEAGKTRDSLDSFNVNGYLDMSVLNNITNYDYPMRFRIKSASDDNSVFYEEILPSAKRKLTNSAILYKNKVSNNGSGCITSLSITRKNGRINVIGKNLDLTGLSAPLVFELKSENTNYGLYYYQAIAYDGDILGSGGNLDVINGKGNVPIQFMSDYKNLLMVDKLSYKKNTKKANADSLTISGKITLKYSQVDLSQLEIKVGFGDYSVTIPYESMYRSGNSNSFKYKRRKNVESELSSALFDFDKCYYKIVIRKADIDMEDGDSVDFSLKFNSFDESMTVSLKDQNNGKYIYP